ncbi:MAG TPA: hypothetical protein PLL92_03720 [Alicycliphilus sp.]|nr:hypothetical protein [Alicycliphilus sp.]
MSGDLALTEAQVEGLARASTACEAVEGRSADANGAVEHTLEGIVADRPRPCGKGGLLPIHSVQSTTSLLPILSLIDNFDKLYKLKNNKFLFDETDVFFM